MGVLFINAGRGDVFQHQVFVIWSAIPWIVGGISDNEAITGAGEVIEGDRKEVFAAIDIFRGDPAKHVFAIGAMVADVMVHHIDEAAWVIAGAIGVIVI